MTFLPNTVLKAADLNTALAEKADATRSITAGTGLSGGGSLASNVTVSLNPTTAVDAMAATQAQAEAGTNNTTLTTPLRVKQAIQSGAFFTQPGTGAVARTIPSKLREIVSVTDFGAVADCTDVGEGTDVIPAIKAAVDYVIANIGDGAKIVLPPGRYRAASAEVLDLNGLKFIELDLQGLLTPDNLAMTVLTIENAQSLTLRASIHEGGVFNGWLDDEPLGPCDYTTTRDAPAAGGAGSVSNPGRDRLHD